jgi:hypothetical protein
MITIIATALATLAIAANGITFDPFIRGMEKEGHVVVSPEFIGLEWDCSAGGGRLLRNDEICFAGLERLADGTPTTELVTGP